jgi:hypothetical protein
MLYVVAKDASLSNLAINSDLQEACCQTEQNYFMQNGIFLSSLMNSELTIIFTCR